MKYRVVIEYDPETRSYSATVLGLPGLFCDAKTERAVLKLAKEGIAFYFQELTGSPRRARGPTAPVPAKVVTVDV